MGVDHRNSPELEKDSGVEFVKYKIAQREHRLNIISQPLNDAISSCFAPPANEDDTVTRLIARRLNQRLSKGITLSFPESAACDIGFKQDDAHISLANATGSVAFTQSLKCHFTLQTPLDDGPFCLLFVQHDTGFNISALHLYSDSLFAPLAMLQKEMWMFHWRWSKVPILILPIAFAKAHDTYIADRIAELNAELALIENLLSSPYGSDGEPLDFAQLTRHLHRFSIALSNMARRAHFQDTVLKTIEETLVTLAGDNPVGMEIHGAHLEALKTVMQSRRYDFETLPKREETARVTIFNLIVQRDQSIGLAMGRANLEIAHSSRQIAEATMRDSAAMRTIAILTMVFLPGTAVASFFSMTMFNWEANGNQSIASGYVWVYFIAAIPLTALVLGIWWYWHRQRDRRTLRNREPELLELSATNETAVQ